MDLLRSVFYCLSCLVYKNLAQDIVHDTLVTDTAVLKFFQDRKYTAPFKFIKNFCGRYNMHGLTVYDELTRHAIRFYIDRKDKFTEVGYWIGVSDFADEGVWLQTNGVKPVIVDWKEGFPTGLRRHNCACAHERTKGMWESISCESELYIACSQKLGKPTIDYVDQTECHGSLDIRWRPHEGSIGVKHRINLQSTDSHHAVLIDEKVYDPGPRTTKVENLWNNKKYKIEITVCTNECCCGDISVSMTMDTTFIGIPTQMNKFTIQKEENKCAATWKWPTAISPEDVTGFKLFVASSPSHKRDVSDDALDQQDVSIIGPGLEYKWPAEPNREYVIWGQTETCSGLSKKVKAEGNCRTVSEDSAYIPNPVLIFFQTKKLLQVAIPLGGGSEISCVFVMAQPMLPDQNIVTSSDEDITLDELKAASVNPPSVESPYIAVAIPRSYIAKEFADITLGVGETTQCNMVVAWEKNGPDASFNKDEAEETTQKAQNFQLKREWSYSFYLVTSSIVGEDIVLSRSASCELTAALLSTTSLPSEITEETGDEIEENSGTEID